MSWLPSLAHLTGGLLGAVPLDSHLLELFPLVGAAEEDVVGVEALEDGARPLPLEEDGVLVVAGEVGDDGGGRAVDIGHQLEWLRRVALVLPRERLQPQLVLGERL